MVALLVNAIVMVIGLGISSIILREFNLSVVSRESQAAFYAADTITECLTYWDLKKGVFGSGSLSGLVCDMTKDAGNNDVPVEIDIIEDSSRPTCGGKFTYEYSTDLTLESAKSGNTPNAMANITREESCDPGDPFTVFTRIESNGYNSNTGDNSRKIERGLQLSY